MKLRIILHRVISRRAAVASLLFALFGFSSAAQVFTFDTEAEFTNNFVSIFSEFSYSSLPGAGGVPGRVNYGLSANRPLILDRSFAFTLTPALFASTWFYYDQITYSSGRENNEIIKIGFVNSTTNWLGPGDVNASYLNVEVVVGTGGIQRKLGAASKSNGGSSESAVYSTNFSISTGWYEIRGDWVENLPDSFDWSVGLLWRGTDGNEAPSLVSSLTGVFGNADIGLDDSVFAAFKGSAGSLAFIDNVTVVPEPRTSALAVLGLSLLVGRWAQTRRRRKLDADANKIAD